MSFEQEIGSVISHFKQHFPAAKIYTAKVPENFAVPSLYFPFPITFDQPFTSASYEKSYLLNVKLFHKTSYEAGVQGEKLAESIRFQKRYINLKNENGTDSGRKLFIDKLDVRPIETGVDDVAVVQIAVEWKSRHKFEEAIYQKVQNIYQNFY